MHRFKTKALAFAMAGSMALSMSGVAQPITAMAASTDAIESTITQTALESVSMDIPRPTYGDTITAIVTPADADVTYQWYNSDGKIEGATEQSYTPTAADVMKQLRVYVKGTGDYSGTVTVRTAAPVQRGTITEVSLDTPRPTFGDTVTAVTVPEDADATYQWYNSNGKIEGATGKSYTPTSEDVMKHLRVYVKGSGAYTGSVTVRTTAPVQRNTITGVSLDIPRPTYGDTLTAVTVPEDADATYQWYNSDGIIEGATDKTYTPTAEDVMKHIRVYVKGSGAYTGSVTVRTTAPVQRAAITGVSLDIPRPTYGDTITAVTVPEDADATYQWYNSDGKIEGATDKSYTPTEEDIMKHLRVYVKGANGYTGNVTVRTTAPVQRPVKKTVKALHVSLADGWTNEVYVQDVLFNEWHGEFGQRAGFVAELEMSDGSIVPIEDLSVVDIAPFTAPATAGEFDATFTYVAENGATFTDTITMNAVYAEPVISIDGASRAAGLRGNVNGKSLEHIIFTDTEVPDYEDCATISYIGQTESHAVVAYRILGEEDTLYITSGRPGVKVIHPGEGGTINTGFIDDIDCRMLDTSRCETIDLFWANGGAFQNGVKSINFSGCDFSNVESLWSAFNGYSSLEYLDLSNCDFSNVEDMSYMCFMTPNLISIDMSGTKFGDGVLTNLYCAFGRSGVQEINFGGLETSAVTNTQGMFMLDKNLKELNLLNCDFSSVVDSTDMFYQNDSLEVVKVNTESSEFIGSLISPGTELVVGYNAISGWWSSLDRNDTSPYPEVEDVISLYFGGYGKSYSIDDNGIITFLEDDTSYGYRNYYHIDETGSISNMDPDPEDTYQYNPESNSITVTHSDGTQTILEYFGESYFTE